MIDIRRVYPECFADTLLIELIFNTRAWHLKGINNVADQLERFQNISLPIVGIIDKDKFTRIPDYIKSFKEIEHKHSLILMQLEKTKKFIVQLDPAFEKWIIEAGASCGITLVGTVYERDFKAFRHDAKDDEVHNNAKFKKFVNSIVTANPPHIQTLRSWIERVFEE